MKSLVNSLNVSPTNITPTCAWLLLGTYTAPGVLTGHSDLKLSVTFLGSPFLIKALQM